MKDERVFMYEAGVRVGREEEEAQEMMTTMIFIDGGTET